MTTTHEVTTTCTSNIAATIATVTQNVDSIDRQLEEARTKMEAGDKNPSPLWWINREKWELAVKRLKEKRCTLGSQLMIDISALTAVARTYKLEKCGTGASVSVFWPFF